jgi:hypothetical protein
MQQMSGEASQPNQTYEYYRYNIQGSDENNVWGSIHAGALNDLQLIINQGSASPYYTGVAKILKAYLYSLVVDVWGKVPYTEAQLLTANTQPHYDDDATIYPKLVQLLTDGVTDLGAGSSVLTPGTNSLIFTNAGNFTTAKAQWIKFANTLKLRLALHYSKINPSKTVTDINAIITAGVPLMTSNADNFSMPFYDVANQRNPISQFEVSRPNYLFSDRNMTERMIAKSDPRLPFYFAIFPFPFTQFSATTSAASSGNTLVFPYTPGITAGMSVVGGTIPAPYTIVKSVSHTPAASPTTTTITLNDDETTGYSIGSVPSGTSITFRPYFRGVSNVKPPLAPNNNYSRIHTFLRGAVTTGANPPPAPATYPGPVQPFTYTGAAPQRMLTYTEYCFIRAEATFRGANPAPLADANAWFQAGITAGMTEAGVLPVDITTYITTNYPGAPTLQQIMEEKYIALFGVSVEPWTDWRRTGFPVLSPVSNPTSGVGAIPRTLFYPQSEIDLNPNCPGQKSTSLQDKVFWDN